MLLVTAVYAARIVSRGRAFRHVFLLCKPITMRLRGYYRGARQESNQRGRPRVYLRCSDVHSRAAAKDERQCRGDRRTRNNQRADRTDEWDTTVEDIVKSIDGIGACNVN